MIIHRGSVQRQAPTTVINWNYVMFIEWLAFVRLLVHLRWHEMIAEWTGGRGDTHIGPTKSIWFARGMRNNGTRESRFASHRNWDQNSPPDEHKKKLFHCNMQSNRILRIASTLPAVFMRPPSDFIAVHKATMTINFVSISGTNYDSRLQYDKAVSCQIM